MSVFNIGHVDRITKESNNLQRAKQNKTSGKTAIYDTECSSHMKQGSNLGQKFMYVSACVPVYHGKYHQYFCN